MPKPKKTAKRAAARTPATPRASGMRFVRLKPHNKRRGHVMRVYVHAPTGKKFEERRGWYKVDLELANYLESVLQREGDEDSPRAFDVRSTREQCDALDAKDAKEVIQRRAAAEANDLSTGDLGYRRSAARALDAAGDRIAASRAAPTVRGPRSMRAAEPAEA
jgi:hypothetical protein